MSLPYSKNQNTGVKQKGESLGCHVFRPFDMTMSKSVCKAPFEDFRLNTTVMVLAVTIHIYDMQTRF